MRVSMPHVGNLYVPIKALFQRLNIDYVVPPANSQRTLSLGVKYSPEGLCIPFKLTLGNMIESAEMGADTLLMVLGSGICRLGYYTKIQEQILRDLGYNVEMICLSMSEDKLLNFTKLFKRLSNNASLLELLSAFRLGRAKINALDRIERLVQKVRAVELVKGTANRLYSRAIEAIDKADDSSTIRRVQTDYIGQLNNVPKDIQAQPLIVGITGELYVVLEPFSSFDVESELGKLGVEVRRKLFFSRWIRFSRIFYLLGIDEYARIHKAARPYLKRDIGGDGWESVGEKVFHAKDYDGLVHIAPFTCMPEIVAQNIMSSTKEDIPVLTLLCDEQITKPGMLTRLEAFVDLLKRRRARRHNSH